MTSGRYLPAITQRVLVGAIAAACSMSAYALQLGHSRILSAAGQPLLLRIPITDITATESDSLRVSLAPETQWRQAGLSVTIPLSSLRVTLERNEQGLAKQIQVQSQGAVHAAVVDVLLDIHSASGQEQRQISVLQSYAPTLRATPLAAKTTKPVSQLAGSANMTVRRGDTLWGLAQANLPAQVSVYQWLMAVYEANPEAFIQGNIHRLKQGARLTVPDAAAMQKVDASQAKRAFFALSQAGSATASAQGQVEAQAESDSVSAAETNSRLRLSQTDPQSEAASREQMVKETTERISQLEENVHNLGVALQSQGKAVTDLLLEGAQSLGLPTDHESALSVLDSSEASPANGASVDGAASATPEQTAEPGSATANHSSTTLAEKAKSKVSWFQENMLAVMGTLLALIVFLIAWVLRRANSASQELDDAPALVTEAMVREKLEQINLDLDQPPSDEPAARH